LQRGVSVFTLAAEERALSAESIYWTASIFLWLLFTGIGLPPVPEEAGILYAAGLSSLHPEVTWWMAWPAASGGIIGADILLYGVGRWFGERIFQYRWVSRVIPPERQQRLQGRFHDHGLKFLLMSRLLPPLRTGVFLIAGSMRYPFRYFLIADVAYGLVGVGLVFFGGTTILALIHWLGSWLLLLAAVAVVGFLLYRYYRYLRKLELKAAAQVVDAIAPKNATQLSEKQSTAP
jgi:membrane protein DedA with SNARE-associated domain